MMGRDTLNRRFKKAISLLVVFSLLLGFAPSGVLTGYAEDGVTLAPGLEMIENDDGSVTIRSGSEDGEPAESGEDEEPAGGKSSDGEPSEDGENTDGEPSGEPAESGEDKEPADGEPSDGEPAENGENTGEEPSGEASEPGEEKEPADGEPSNGEPAENGENTGEEPSGEAPEPGEEKEPADGETSDEQPAEGGDVTDGKSSDGEPGGEPTPKSAENTVEPEPEVDELSGLPLLTRKFTQSRLRSLLGSGAVEWVDLPVAYLDENGASLIHSDTIKVRESSTTWGAEDYASWYAVTEDVTVDSRITMNGNVCLILTDGATLTASGIKLSDGASLTIYAQTDGAGRGALSTTHGECGIYLPSTASLTIIGGEITARGTGTYGTGIGAGNNEGKTHGAITIMGGVVRAYGHQYGAAIGTQVFGTAGEVNIYDGEVYAIADNMGSGIGGAGGAAITGHGGKVTITGGYVEATGATGIGGGFGNAGGNGGTVLITGGEVHATGRNGAGIGGSNGNGSSHTAGDGGSITITGGEVYASSIGGGATGSDTGSAGDISISGGLVNVTGKIGGGGSGTEGSLTLSWTEDAFDSTEVTASSYQCEVTFEKPYVLKSATGTLATVANSAGATIIPGDTAVLPQEGVPYLDENGGEQICNVYTRLSRALSESDTLTAGWYVLDRDLTWADRIVCSGDVHLILTDGKVLTANAGVTVNEGNSLTVYAQSEGEDIGVLTAKASAQVDAAIGATQGSAWGTIAINGGAVTATAVGDVSGSGAGIGGANTNSGRDGVITINGGVITATGSAYGAAIGGGGGGSYVSAPGGIITIRGGTVNATSVGLAAAIGAGGSVHNQSGAGGIITIKGGTVVAESTGSGPAIGGGATVDGAAGGAGNITITGGNVTATSASGFGIGGGGDNTEGTLTLSWTDETFSTTEITASSYGCTMTLDKPYVLKETANQNVGASVTSAAGKTIIPGAVFERPEGGVPYLDENGETQTCTAYTFLSEALGNTYPDYTLTSGWYVLDRDITCASRVTCTGDVHLILTDGKTHNASVGYGVLTTNSLTIYSQCLDENTMGRLNAVGGNYTAGIGGASGAPCGVIIINGGKINAHATTYRGAGIGGGYFSGGDAIVINNGFITCDNRGIYASRSNAAAIGGGWAGNVNSITINGGTVIAHSEMSAGIGGGGCNSDDRTAGSGGVIRITGGTITASSWKGAGIGAGGGLKGRATNANTIQITGGNITSSSEFGAGIGGGVTNSTTGGAGNIRITGGTVNATSASGHGIGGGGTNTSGTLTLGWTADTFSTTSVTANSYGISTVTFSRPYVLKSNTSTVAAYTNSTTNNMAGATIVPGVPAGGVYYLDADGNTQIKASGEYTVLTADYLTANSSALAGGWYAVAEDVTAPARISCSGEVHLILVNGKTLTATNGGIGVNSPNALSIYAQSTDTDAMGSLKATAVNDADGNGSGIGGNYGVDTGTITINGGKITATGVNPKAHGGDCGGAGIGGSSNRSAGTVVINGGYVTATGGTYAAGIGGGEWARGGNITINGGTVIARGNGEAAGIGGGWNPTKSTANNITINGGTVTATGNERGAGIGGGGRSNSTSGGQTGGTITINGGTVTATSPSGAGIGGGNNSNYTTTTGTGGTIIITGGTVNATANAARASAIGGAGNAAGGSITITGGTITANGKIGGGGTNTSGTLTLGWRDNNVTSGYPRVTSSGYQISALTYQTDAGETECFTREGDPSHGLLGAVDLNGFTESTTIIPWRAAQPVTPYLDYVDGKMETRYRGEYTVLTAEYLADNNYVLTDGWYLSNGALALDSDTLEEAELVTCGDVHLILMNASNLNVRGVIVSEGNALTIYQQPVRDGETVGILTADRATKPSNGACIGGGRDPSNCDAGTIIINGGVINALGQMAGGANKGAGIGGGCNGKRGVIIINGGTIDARGNAYGAGIGGSLDNNRDVLYGSITINGGTVTARGSRYSAGIGGGVYSSGGVITITGGEITASTMNGNAGGGAGIGGGQLGEGGVITITGGDITAYGYSNGAGIGGGGAGGAGRKNSGGSGGIITITGGTIHAYGGIYNSDNCGGGAGIGGGGQSLISGIYYAAGSAGTITITGGNIEATGGTGGTDGAESGSDIGSGVNAIGGTITLTSDNPASGYPRVTAQKYAGTLTLGTAFVEEGGTRSLSVSDILGFTARKTIYPMGSLPEADRVPYLDYVDGGMTTRWAISPTAITADYLTANSNILAPGWYVVNGEVTAANRIICSGEVRLILKDGCALTAQKGINVPGNASLTVYGQTEQTGILTANGADNGAGIGGNYGNHSDRANGVRTAGDAGSIIIVGGNITAVGDHQASGIGGGHQGDVSIVTIYGGNVNARGGSYGAGIGGGGHGNGGTVSIYGGTVYATGGNYAAGIGSGGTDSGGVNASGRLCSGGTVAISGGTVTASGGNNGGAGIGGGSYNSGGVSAGGAGTISITGGIVTATSTSSAGIGGGGTNASGTLTLDWADSDGSSALPKITASSYQLSTVTYANPAHGFKKLSDGAAVTTDALKSLTGQTIVPDATPAIPYLDYEDGEMTEKFCTAYTPIGSAYLSAHSYTLSAGWYAVDADATVGMRIVCTGDVRLILKDGVKLIANGISVDPSNSLTIYAQSEDANNMGELEAIASHYAGIGGSSNISCGNVTINGGKITAESKNHGAGIGGGFTGSGGNITINGGIVNATGAPTVSAAHTVGGAGIGGGSGRDNNSSERAGDGGNITINGGTVTATSVGYAAGMGGGGGGSGGAGGNGGTIKITGGIVNASVGSTGGAGIGGGNTGNAGSITITGGTVAANGKIGGGGTNTTGTLTLGWADSDASSGLPEITASSYQVASLTYRTAGQAFGLKTAPDAALTTAQVKALTDATIVPVPQAPVSYLDYVDGEMAEKSRTGYTEIDADYFTVYGYTLPAGWYAVTGEVMAANRIICSGEVRLILKDGCVLTASAGGVGVNSGNSLTIYAQSTDESAMGALIATGGTDQAGIGGTNENTGGDITINGGRVTALSAGRAAGIGGGCNKAYNAVLTINGGYVSATGAGYGAGIGGGTANEDSDGSGQIIINGGTVNATSASGAGIGGGGTNASGTLTLGWADSDGASALPRITCSSYQVDTVTYADPAQPFQLEGGAADASLTTEEIKALTDSTIIPSGGGVVYLDYVDGEILARRRGDYTPLSEYLARPENTVADGTGTAYQLNAGWYLADTDIEAEKHLIINGTVNLILKNGATLKAKNGVCVSTCYNGDLTVLQQPVGDGETVGKLISTASNGAGIGGFRNYGASGYPDTLCCGSITINGGMIEATGASSGAGIGGGDARSGGYITINYGDVMATGAYNAAGIGAGWQAYVNSITINGGDVKAYGGGSSTDRRPAGIGGNALTSTQVGTVTITGGKVTAGFVQDGGGPAIGNATVNITGGEIHAASRGSGSYGIGYAGDAINLSWTADTYNSTEITATSYNGTVNFVKPYLLQADGSLATTANIAGNTIVPGVALSGAVTQEGRRYDDVSGTETSVSLPVNSAWTVKWDMTALQSCAAELGFDGGTFSDGTVSFSQAVPAGSVLTLTAVTESGGNKTYEHYYMVPAADSPAIRLTSFTSMRNRGERFSPAPTDGYYLLSVDYSPCEVSPVSGARVRVAMDYIDRDGDRGSTLPAEIAYSLVSPGALTATATTVTVAAQPSGSALLAGTHVYLIGTLPESVKLQNTAAKYGTINGKWISGNIVAFDLGAYGSLSDVGTAKTVTFDWLGQPAGSHTVSWKLCAGSAAWNICGHPGVNELTEVSPMATATITKSASEVERRHFKVTERTKRSRLYATGGQNITFDVSANCVYGWYVEKQTGLLNFTQVSGAAYFNDNIAKTVASVTVPIPAEAGTYRVKFSTYAALHNDDVYYTVIVE